jgi:hypothetical protein
MLYSKSADEAAWDSRIVRVNERDYALNGYVGASQGQKRHQPARVSRFAVQPDGALFQPVLPLTKSNVLRPALPFIQSSGPGGVSGIGDLFLLDAFMFQVPHATWGLGPVATLPTATSDALGSGKYQLGMNALYIYKGIPKNIFGILGYNQWSVAGDSDRKDVNKLSFQPIWVKHFDWGYMGWSDQTATVDWENGSALSFPIGLRFGKVWGGKQPLNVAIEPYYILLSADRDQSFFRFSSGHFGSQ